MLNFLADDSVSNQPIGREKRGTGNRNSSRSADGEGSWPGGEAVLSITMQRRWLVRTTLQLPAPSRSPIYTSVIGLVYIPVHVVVVKT